MNTLSLNYGFGVDWAVGVESKYNNKTFVVIKMYTPYETNNNEAEYLHRLAHVWDIY